MSGRAPTAVAVVLALAGSVLAAEVEVRTSVDQTALWPGDRLRYVVEVRCAPGVDLLAEDLGGDRLILSGLELIDFTRERRLEDDGHATHFARYELAAYDLGAPPRIEERRLRYFARRPGQALADAAPAGEVVVPAVSLVVRSTLPDDLRQARLRDERGLPEPPLLVTWAGRAGLALVLLSAAPVAAASVSWLRRRWREGRARRPRAGTADLRPDLAELRAVDAGPSEARRKGYDRLDLLLRRRLTCILGVDARTLTAGELAARLEAGPAGLPPALAAVLEECERARYSTLDALPTAERFQAGVAAAAAVVGERRWS